MDDVIVDGGLLVFIGDGGLPVFLNLRGLAGSQVCLYVFDVLWLETDRRPAPLCDRRALIESLSSGE